MQVNFADIATVIREVNANNGWQLTTKLDLVDKSRLYREKLVLIHCEISEAVEAYRDSKSHKEERLANINEEMADVIIRSLDFAYAEDVKGSMVTMKKSWFNPMFPDLPTSSFNERNDFANFCLQLHGIWTGIQGASGVHQPLLCKNACVTTLTKIWKRFPTIFDEVEKKTKKNMKRGHRHGDKVI